MKAEGCVYYAHRRAISTKITLLKGRLAGAQGPTGYSKPLEKFKFVEFAGSDNSRRRGPHMTLRVYMYIWVIRVSGTSSWPGIHVGLDCQKKLGSAQTKLLC